MHEVVIGFDGSAEHRQQFVTALQSRVADIVRELNLALTFERVKVMSWEPPLPPADDDVQLGNNRVPDPSLPPDRSNEY